MATYLVTGAAGFIAAKVCEQLLAAGHTVVGIDNLNDYYDVRLKYYRLSALLELDPAAGGGELMSAFGQTEREQKSKSGRFIFQRIDIENLAVLDRPFDQFRFDAIFHLAARAGVRASVENPYVFLSTNTLGTLNILECQRKHGVRKLVLASTSSLYAGCDTPFTEDIHLNFPLSPYAATKRAAELLSYTYHVLHDLDISVLRYFTVFGPAGRPDMAPFRFLKSIEEGGTIELFGDGSYTRDFTFVDDIARGTVLAVKPVGYEVINLGGGVRPMSIVAFIRVLETFARKTAKIRLLPVQKADVSETWANIGKAKRLLDWKPEIDVEEGVRRLVAWHRSNDGLVRQIVQ